MIRAIVADDAGAVAALIRAAFAAIVPPPDPPASAARVDAAAVLAHLRGGGGGALVPAAGCVLWSRADDVLHVSRLAVLPAWRGRGVAGSLLDAAEAEARRRGLAGLRLEVRLALAGNRRLFARAGYVETAERAHPGYPHPTFAVAEKRLPA